MLASMARQDKMHGIDRAGLLGGGQRLALLLQFISALGAMTGVYWVWRRGSFLPIRASVLVLATLLVTPHAMNYDLTLLLLPIAWVAREGRRNNWGTRNNLILTAVWCSPFLNLISVGYLDLHLAPVIIAVFLIYLLSRVGEVNKEKVIPK